jgi:hypothetical protein
LWLLSEIARYLGTAFYVFSAGAAAFALLSSGGVMNIGIVWAVTMTVLSVAAAFALIFSKPFAKEFAVEREKRPTCKKHLLKAFTILIVLAAAGATFNDIVNLASN